MEDKGIKTPFDAFDFFGYIMPGTIFLTGIWVHDKILFNKNEGPCIQFWNSIFAGQNATLDIYPLILFIGIIITYIMGHVVAAFGSAILDRIVIGRVNYYPYESLLQLTDRNREEFKHRCDKICLVFIILVSIYIAYYEPKKSILCVAGIIVLATFFLKQIINRIWHKKEVNANKTLKYKEIIKGWMIIFLPFYLITWAFHKLLLRSTVTFLMMTLRIGRPFPESFREIFNNKFIKVYGKDINEPKNNLETNIFWLAGMYVVRNLPSNAAMAQRAYNLSTLTRNLTMSVLLLFWYGVSMHYGYKSLMKYLNISIGTGAITQTTLDNRYYIWITITAIFTGILWVRFYNTYYNHYTKIVLRSFVTPKEMDPKEMVPQEITPLEMTSKAEKKG